MQLDQENMDQTIVITNPILQNRLVK